MVEAYKKARISLLELEALPLVGLDEIRPCYSTEIQLMEHGRVSPDELGLQGDGPWQVLLCGYLFHALNRDAAALRCEPYSPIIANRYFP